MATSDAPVEIDHVTLTVRDLEKVADFYETVIGLARLTLRADAERRAAIAGRTAMSSEGRLADPFGIAVEIVAKPEPEFDHGRSRATAATDA